VHACRFAVPAEGASVLVDVDARSARPAAMVVPLLVALPILRGARRTERRGRLEPVVLARPRCPRARVLVHARRLSIPAGGAGVLDREGVGWGSPAAMVGRIVIARAALRGARRTERRGRLEPV